jgi:undecaprenyl phosphate-alpha-L-ara4N flippase subunit ArnE
MSKSSDTGDPQLPDMQPGMRHAVAPVGPPEHDATERSSNEATMSGRYRLTIASMALLLFAVGSAAVGQVMLKHGMQIATARAHAGRSLAISAVTSPWVLFGLMVFGISAVAWLATLSRVPLSIAYPFNALGYLGILTASVLVLHERASSLTWLGSLLVVAGLIMVVLSRP